MVRVAIPWGECGRRPCIEAHVGRLASLWGECGRRPCIEAHVGRRSPAAGRQGRSGAGCGPPWLRYAAARLLTPRRVMGRRVRLWGECGRRPCIEARVGRRSPAAGRQGRSGAGCGPPWLRYAAARLLTPRRVLGRRVRLWGECGRRPCIEAHVGRRSPAVGLWRRSGAVCGPPWLRYAAARLLTPRRVIGSVVACCGSSVAVGCGLWSALASIRRCAATHPAAGDRAVVTAG